MQARSSERNGETSFKGRSETTRTVPEARLARALIKEPSAYPFSLPIFRSEFEMRFSTAITTIVGENGVGKSTLIEAIAALAGYDVAGGGKGYMPMDHSQAVEANGDKLARALKAAWLPKVTDGWFFRAESFFGVSRYLDTAALDVGAAPPDFLSHSHGEGFLRFFEERTHRRGIYFFDEPESALSPARQLEFLKLLDRMQRSKTAQVIMATHAPILMAYPEATLLRMTKSDLEPVRLEDTAHYRLLHQFTLDPSGFVADALKSDATER